MIASMVSVSSIKRVVSVFILRPKDDNPQNVDVAVFHRCPTMPTFANHWAGISGSIEEKDDSPLEAAVREIREETNVCDVIRNWNQIGYNLELQSCIKGGLYLDVSKKTHGAFGGRVIRVYPFALTLPLDFKSRSDDQSLLAGIEIRGTEHDNMKFISIKEFLELTPCVPELQTAFHHATCGSFLELPTGVRLWESDQVNGAATLARHAVHLVSMHPNTARSIAMLRPSMVPIVNAMKAYDYRTQVDGQSKVGEEILRSLELEVKRCVKLAVDTIIEDYKKFKASALPANASFEDFVIGTFSRSSTLKLILEQVQEVLQHSNNTQPSSLQVVSSQSTPGDEGELMAKDIPGATWLDDTTFQRHIQEGKINLVIVGADCVLSDGGGVVNKIGTRALAKVCQSSNVPVKCFADRSKLWDDVYPPPLEEIFEFIPLELFDCVVIPPSSEQ